MTKRAVGRPWTAHEDQLLADAVAVHGQVDNWKAVALSVPGRTNKACRKRWLHSLSPNVKKTAWTREEDDLLLELYKIHSAKWALIARNIPGRTDDACSKRYREALDPCLKKDEWTEEEDERLVDAYHRLGGQWGRVGQELQRSGLGCRNRWRLLERKAHSAKPNPVWPQPMYWDEPLDNFYPYLPPQKQPDALLLPPSDGPSTATTVFAPFDYESSSSVCTLSVGSTSPAPTYTDDMHHPNAYSDCPHHFHQLQRTVPHTAIPAHSSSAHPVQVDHYAAPVPHEERSLSHAALTTGHQPSPQSSLRAQNSADAYFTPSRVPDQQSSHMPSPMMTSVSLLDNPDTFYHVSPKQPLDVNPQHALPCTPDPLSSRPGYHYALHRDDLSRARVLSVHDQDRHAGYHLDHVQPDQYSVARYAVHHPAPSQPEAGPSRATPDHFSPYPLLPSQLVRRTCPSPRPVPAPYPKRPSSQNSTNSEDHARSTPHSVPRRKIGEATCRRRPDSQAPLRLSSDLQATPDPSVKPYACGHESCWPTDAASSRACYCTSRGLSDHNKAAHPEDSGGDRPYRCGLEGCGKSWKSINGLQYHLQISKAHFQHAITSSFVSSYINGLAVPASEETSAPTEAEDRTKRQYKCPHESCPNRYKQLSGLRYHLAHGHPVELPKQLDLVPPALSRKLAEKMRVQGSPSGRSNDPDRSTHAGSFDS